MTSINEYFDTLRGKRIAVIGMGVSNTPLIRMLLRADLNVTVRDKAARERVEEIAEELESLGAKLKLGEEYLEELDEDIIFRSLEDDVDLYLLRQALTQLSQREREIVEMRYGLAGRKELTQKEVAAKMGISQSYISRLEKRIMLRLRKEMIRQTSCA